MKWKLVYTRQARKDAKKVRNSKLKQSVIKLMEIMENDPVQSPPLYQKLVGDLSGAYYRRTNIQQRIVCQIDEEKRIMKITRMWTHYE